MATALGLSDRVVVRTERVERTGHDPGCRGQFDLAMARAVAAAPVVAEYLVPLLQQQGQALLYRGRWQDSDDAELQPALKLLNARSDGISRTELPADRGPRTLIRISTDRATPKIYPRAIGVPTKFPLGGQADERRS